MPSVLLDKDDPSKGFYWQPEGTDKPNCTSSRVPKQRRKSKPLTEIVKIWVCLQLYKGKTYKQIQRKLKVYSLAQLKRIPDSPYTIPGLSEPTGSSYYLWWTDFFNDQPSNDCGLVAVRGAGEFYLMRLADLRRMDRDLKLSDYEEYIDDSLLSEKEVVLRSMEAFLAYKKEKELLDECFQMMTQY